MNTQMVLVFATVFDSIIPKSRQPVVYYYLSILSYGGKTKERNSWWSADVSDQGEKICQTLVHID